jgi:hypothetical protein
VGGVGGCLKVGGCCRGSPAGNRADVGVGMSVLPRPLHIAMNFPTGASVTFGKYRASRNLRHLRRLGDANSFLLREHTLASSYGD